MGELVDAAHLNVRQAYANLHGLSLSRYDGVMEDLAKARPAATEAEDRLVLAVQAEMDCYYAIPELGWNNCDDWVAADESRIDVPSGVPCEPCTARAALKVPV